jgi:hypothetical protein
LKEYVKESDMRDFNDYANENTSNGSDSGQGIDKNLYNLVNSLAGKFDGKSQNDLIRAIYQEAKKGKQNGTLTNAEIDNFATMLAPLLDKSKQKMLYKIVEELKAI